MIATVQLLFEYLKLGVRCGASRLDAAARERICGLRSVCCGPASGTRDVDSDCSIVSTIRRCSTDHVPLVRIRDIVGLGSAADGTRWGW